MKNCPFLYKNRFDRLVCGVAHNRKKTIKSKSGQPFVVMIANCKDCPRGELNDD